MQPSPALVLISAASPFPSQLHVFSSLLYLQTDQVVSPSPFTCSDTNRRNHNHNLPASQLQPEQPPWQGAQGKLANQAQPTLLLTGKVRQSFGELEHPYCMWSFQMNGSAEGAQQLFQAWDCASRPINHSAPGRFS